MLVWALENIMIFQNVTKNFIFQWPPDWRCAVCVFPIISSKFLNILDWKIHGACLNSNTYCAKVSKLILYQSSSEKKKEISPETCFFLAKDDDKLTLKHIWIKTNWKWFLLRKEEQKNVHFVQSYVLGCHRQPKKKKYKHWHIYIYADIYIYFRILH